MPHRLAEPVTTSGCPQPDRLRPEVEDVARCGCGPAYVPRENVRREIQRLLETLHGKIRPQLLHVLAPLAAVRGHVAVLADERELEVRAAPGCEDEGLDGAEALGAVLCTVGEVDDRLEAMIATDGPLAAWIGQAIALAQLEMLEQLAAHSLAQRAAEYDLRPVRFVEPGVATRSQRDLFHVLGPAPARLTDHGTMDPRMSYTFWVTLAGPGA